MDFLPSNLDPSSDNLTLADKILSKQDNIIIRYLRKSPTVGIGLFPVRDEAGAILEDIPWKKRQVICHGVPTGCMVAILVGGVLRIGWSRRFDSKKLLETSELHTLFREVLENTRNVTENAENYSEVFDSFCSSLISVLTNAPAKDIEVAFRKDAGRHSAVVRALLDDITIYRRFMKSSASGAIPNDVARGLKWFIPQAEKKFAMTAGNVTKGNMSVAASEGHAVTVV